MARRITDWAARRWLWILNIVLGVWVITPWFAPVFMRWEWNGVADAIYFLYSLQCHQLPQRSFFLFGERLMYSLPQVQAAWQETGNPFLLRRFIGSPEMGWKVAWSDRMVSAYTSLWLGGLLYGAFRRRMKAFPVWAFILLLTPMALDGGTHLLSDLAGIGQGFRDSNAWLQIATQNVFPASFYQGDAIGSFNSWMRLLTGLFFGLGAAGFLFPRMGETFVNSE
ncbi:MAG: DUF2085 domain-containing protein [Anaerolineales bacterium]|jgi:uncharacterized membrane protein|nr:DUF2085 domain-containing protein [Anaerolineales bacterium]